MPDEVIEVQPEEAAVAPVSESALMPTMTVDDMLARYGQINEFVQKILVEGDGRDYGIIPGTKQKTLYKAGAEKLCALFSLAVEFEVLEKVEQWEGPEPFFMYTYRCTLMRHGIACGQAVGSCNSRETKYRYRWVNEHDLPPAVDKALLFSQDGTLWEPCFAVEKAETQGKYGKPIEYWGRFREQIAAGTAVKVTKKRGKWEGEGWEIGGRMYRLPNPEIADQVHTISAMAQKRALVGAVRVTTGVSNIFVEEKPPSNIGSDEPPPPPPPPGEEPLHQGRPKFDFKQMLGDFQNLKSRAVQVLGKERGEGLYYRYLGEHGVEKSNQFSSRDQAAGCWKEMAEAIENAEKAKKDEKKQAAAQGTLIG